MQPESQLIESVSGHPVWWQRRAFVRLVLFLCCVQFAWLFENYRGVRAIQVEMRLLADLGCPVVWNPETLPGPVPDSENFGAVPCLHGLWEDEFIPLEEREVPIRTDIPGWEGLQLGSVSLLDRKAPPLLPTTKQKRAPRHILPTPQPLDWPRWRKALAYSGYFPTPPDHLPDEQAVLRALDKLEPVFGQLSAAVDRPYAIFLPAPRVRFRDGPPKMDDGRRSESRLNMLASMLTLRGQAAIACRDEPEARRMLRILFRLSDAMNNELGWATTRHLAGDYFLHGLQQHIWDSGGLHEFASAVRTPAAEWMLQNLRREIILDGLDRYTVGESFFMRFVDQSLPWFLPQGWADQGRAWKLRTYREELLEPLLAKGMDGWIGREDSFARAQSSVWTMWSIGYMGGPCGFPMNGRLVQEMHRRLLLAATSLEQSRLQTGSYPSSLPAPDAQDLAEIRQDLDGKPLRYLVSSDGRQATLYSVALNLRDDWQGSPPPEQNHAPTKHKDANKPSAPPQPRKTALRARDDDWLLRLDAP